MDIATRLQNFVGKRAGATGLRGTVIGVRPFIVVGDDIEDAITWSEFTLRLDSGERAVIPGRLLDELDNNAYLVPEDCPWMETVAR